MAVVKYKSDGTLDTQSASYTVSSDHPNGLKTTIVGNKLTITPKFATQSLVYDENFESLTLGSLGGQAGWVNTVPNTSVTVADLNIGGRSSRGIDQTSPDLQGAIRSFPNLEQYARVRFQFDAYASSTNNPSHASYIGLLPATPGTDPLSSGYPKIGWYTSTNSSPTPQWIFTLTAGSRDFVLETASGFNSWISLEVVADRLTNQVYGRYKFGDVWQETTRFSISSSQMAAINGIAFKNVNVPGSYYDNFKVYGEQTYSGPARVTVTSNDTVNGVVTGRTTERNIDVFVTAPPVPVGNSLISDTIAGRTFSSTTALLNGDYVVAWSEKLTGTGEIRMQLFDRSGVAKTSMNVVATNQPGAAWVRVDSNASGDFAVTWEGASNGGIQSRRYLASGDLDLRDGNDGNIIPIASSGQETSQVVLPNGDIVFAFNVSRQAERVVRLRRGTNTVDAMITLEDAGSPGLVFRPSISCTDSGLCSIIWERRPGLPGIMKGVQVQFGSGADNQSVGSIRDLGSAFVSAIVASNSGTLAVLSSPNGGDVYLTRYQADFSRPSTPVLVAHGNATIVPGPNESYFITWTDDAATTISGQLISINGDVLVPTFAIASSNQPAVFEGYLHGLAWDNFGPLVSWSTHYPENDSTPRSVYAQRFSLESNPGSAAIYGNIYLDVDGNDSRGSSEPSVSGVVVELLQGITVVASTTSDANGDYAFRGLGYGVYAVRRASTGSVGAPNQSVVLTVAKPVATAINLESQPIVELGESRQFSEGTSQLFTVPANAFQAGATYVWKVDGIVRGTGNSFTHVFTNGGTLPTKYTVSVAVDGTPTGPGAISGTYTDSVDVFVSNVAPNGLTLGAVAPINEGQDLNLTASATDAGGDALTYSWDINSDGVFGGPEDIADTNTGNVTVPWSKLASLASGATIRVRVKDEDGAVAASDATTTVTINNLAPNNVNAHGPYSIVAGFGSVTLSGSTSDPGGDAITYAWSFDGGATFPVAGATPTLSWNDLLVHSASPMQMIPALATPGQYTDKLVLRASDGQASTTVNAIINVTNTSPLATIGGPYTINEGSGLTISAAGSSDADGHVIEYAWDIDNDGNFDDGDGRTLSLTWAQLNDIGIKNGTLAARTVSVLVTDAFGNRLVPEPSQIASSTLSITNLAPTATVDAPLEAVEGTDIDVSFNDIVDLPEDVLSFSVDVDGNGLFSDAVDVHSSNPQVTFQFTDNGTRVINLRVADADGGSTVYTRTVNVANKAPIGKANLSSSAIDEGSSITFGVQLADLNDAAADISSLKFAFDMDGHGVFDTNNDGVFNNDDFISAMTQTRSYFVDGRYTLGVLIQDKDGATSEPYTATLDVRNVLPTITAFSLLTPTTPAIKQGDLLQFTGSFTDPANTADLGKWTGVAIIRDAATNLILEQIPLKINQSTMPVNGQVTFSLEHTITQRGNLTVTAMVTDGESLVQLADPATGPYVDANGTTRESTPVLISVTNVAPTIESPVISGVIAGRESTLKLVYADPGDEATAEAWEVDALTGKQKYRAASAGFTFSISYAAGQGSMLADVGPTRVWAFEDELPMNFIKVPVQYSSSGAKTVTVTITDGVASVTKVLNNRRCRRCCSGG